jgi:hypothetical protein
MERWEQFEELSLLWAWDAELFLTIASPSQVRSHLSARMQATALRHNEMVGELTVLWAAVSSAVKLMLGRSPNETSWVDVTNELVAKFRWLEELCLQLKGPGTRICDLLLRLPPSQVQWADRLDEAVRRLEVELAEWRQVDAELEALWTSIALVRDLVLGNVDGPSSLEASLCMVAELLEGRIDTTATSGVYWWPPYHTFWS